MAISLCFSFFKTGPGLPFICLASGMAIWFVISTIFIRGEVLKHQPFFWAIVYSIGLKYFLATTNIFNINFLLIIALATLVGLIASIRNNWVEFTRWSCLAFIPFLYLPPSLYPYLAALSLLLASFNFSKTKSNKAKWILYFIQLAGILTNIYLTPTKLAFIGYVG